ncbi:MAG: transglutaminase family protein, partial [Ktedonobacteraceae bacterium]|nr:transglutaminase family protein [Ktedonobacteraceae bacterium]
MHIRVGCEFQYEATWPTPTVMLVEPHRDGAHTIMREEWKITPDIAKHAYYDIYGNLCQRLVLPEGAHSLSYDAVVKVSDDWDPVAPETPQLPVEDLPGDALLYTMPSRFCQSDVLSDTAWQLFGSTEPGWKRVQAVCDWVHEHIRFQYGTST